MNRLSENQKNQISNLIEKDYSLNKIYKKLGLPKSTVYYHYRKKKGRKYKKLKLNPSFSKIEGEIVGIFTGDGSQYFDKKRYGYQVNVHFGIKNRDYAEYVKQLFENYFGKNFYINQEKDVAIRIRTKSKDIFYFFKNYLDYNPKIKHSTVRLKKIDLPNGFAIGFLKGLVDTDGSVLYIKVHKSIRISYCTTSKSLANQIKNLISKLEIECGLYEINRAHRKEKTLYIVQIYKKHNKRFLRIINPWKKRLLGQ